MYHVYIKEQGLGSRKLIGEYKDLDDAYGRVDDEIAKNKDVKYVIEESTGHVNNYGDLIVNVVEEN